MSLMYFENEHDQIQVIGASMLASQLQEPIKERVACIRRTLRYLRETFRYEIKIKPGDGVQLTVLVYTSLRSHTKNGSRNRWWLSMQ